MAKVYDCFSFFNELDLLEIRFNILDKHVDYFVIMESRQTFSGKEKPLYFHENRERFSKWWDKIIVIEPMAMESVDSFKRAFYQKESLKDVLMNSARDEDIIYYGDVDEIWTPVHDFAIFGDKVYNLEQLNYCYYLNNRSSENWVGTIVGKWETIKTNTFAHWRATHTYEVKPGGWHFTNMGGADQILKKLDAYDHQEFNLEVVRAGVKSRMENDQDYVGRQVDWQGKPFSFHIDDIDLPQYLKDNKDKYATYFKS